MQIVSDLVEKNKILGSFNSNETMSFLATAASSGDSGCFRADRAD